MDFKRNWPRYVVIAAGISLSGCAGLSDFRQAGPDVAAIWHATLPHDGKTADLVSWWSTFNDPSLSELLRIAQRENPDIASAAADIDQARASLDAIRASLFPALDGSGSATRSGTGGSSGNRTATVTTWSGGLDSSWELDLFGKNRRKSEAAGLRVDEQIANWHQARVSLAAEVADYYVQYRACRQLENAYSVELASQRETIRAMGTAAASGLTSGADFALAKASAAASSSALTAQRSECEVLIKSLALLTDGDEANVRRLLAKGKAGIPRPKAFKIAAVPAEALRQRPDINALELEVAAAIADVGAAQADLYPSLSLGGSVTINSSTLAGTSVPWSFGPALTIPVFDGGSRRAAVSSAIADYDKAVASYKSGVLTAVAEVETALVRVDSARRQIGDAAVAARNYRFYFNSIDDNWKAGGASLLDREQARRSAQSAEITLIETRRDAVLYWIALYKTLGGGWDGEAPVPTPATRKIQGSLD